jgi:hypothetical protein
VGAALQVAQHDRHPVLLGQPPQLPVEQRSQVEPDVSLQRRGLGHVSHLPFPGAPAGGNRPGLQGGAAGDAVQPVADQLAGHDRGRPAGEDEEGGLEGVLGVLLVGQHAAADA